MLRIYMHCRNAHRLPVAQLRRHSPPPLWAGGRSHAQYTALSHPPVCARRHTHAAVPTATHGSAHASPLTPRSAQSTPPTSPDPQPPRTRCVCARAGHGSFNRTRPKRLACYSRPRANAVAFHGLLVQRLHRGGGLARQSPYSHLNAQPRAKKPQRHHRTYSSSLLSWSSKCATASTFRAASSMATSISPPAL